MKNVLLQFESEKCDIISEFVFVEIERDNLENSSKTPRTNTTQSVSGTKTATVSPSVSTSTIPGSGVPSETTTKNTLSLPSSSSATSAPQGSQKTSPKSSLSSVAAARTEDTPENEMPNWLQNVNSKQMGRVLQKVSVRTKPKKRIIRQKKTSFDESYLRC